MSSPPTSRRRSIFFCRMFDARCVWDEQAAGARNVRIALGNAFIHLYDRPLKGPRSGPVHHIGIETDDLEALVSRMCAQGFVFRNPIRREPKFNYVMVMGPDDLLTELFQCHEPERWQVQRSGPRQGCFWPKAALNLTVKTSYFPASSVPTAGLPVAPPSSQPPGATCLEPPRYALSLDEFRALAPAPAARDGAARCTTSTLPQCSRARCAPCPDGRTNIRQ